jgi:hypothetical protein
MHASSCLQHLCMPESFELCVMRRMLSGEVHESPSHLQVRAHASAATRPRRRRQMIFMIKDRSEPERQKIAEHIELARKRDIRSFRKRDIHQRARSACAFWCVIPFPLGPSLPQLRAYIHAVGRFLGGQLTASGPQTAKHRQRVATEKETEPAPNERMSLSSAAPVKGTLTKGRAAARACAFRVACVIAELAFLGRAKICCGTHQFFGRGFALLLPMPTL